MSYAWLATLEPLLKTLEHIWNTKVFKSGSNIVSHVWLEGHTIDFESARVIDRRNSRIRKTLESWHTAITSQTGNNSKQLPRQYSILLLLAFCFHASISFVFFYLSILVRHFFYILSPFYTHTSLPSLFPPYPLKIAAWQSKARVFHQRTSFLTFQLCPLITQGFLKIYSRSECSKGQNVGNMFAQ